MYQTEVDKLVILLDLAGMELIFFVLVCIVLCFILVAKTVDGTVMFWLLLNNALHRWRLSPTTTGRLRQGRKLRGNTCSATEAQGKEEEAEGVCARGVWLPKQALCEPRPCFPATGQTSACRWEVASKFFSLLCLCMQLFLYLLNFHYLDP